MRALPATFLALALLAVPAAVAQDPDGPPGCVEANPCDLIIAVDADGFADLSDTELTEGDWFVATIVNHDDVAHTVSLSGHSMMLTVPAGDVDDTDPFRVGAPGQYTLADQPSGDSVQVTSVAGEEFADGGSSTTGDGSNGIPGLAPAYLLGALAALALGVRRRQ